MVMVMVMAGAMGSRCVWYSRAASQIKQELLNQQKQNKILLSYPGLREGNPFPAQ